MWFEIVCSNCGNVLSYDFKGWCCPKCGSTLTIRYELKQSKLPRWGWKGGIEGFKDFIPCNCKLYSLGECWTPLLKVQLKGLNLYLKLEHVNPTGSFKDRGAVVSVSRAKSLGVKRVREDSSGNAGISTSAYASRARLKAKIYVPHDAPKPKKALIKAFGGEIVEAPSRDEASKLVVKGLGSDEMYIGHLWDPYFIEGVKTLTYELYLQLGLNVDYIVVPVASGTLLLGVYRGLQDLMSLGLIENQPKLIAVQAQGYSVLHSFITNEPIGEVKTKVADALRVSNPPRLKEMVNAIRATDGLTTVVEDDRIIKAHRILARKGLLVEPTSATTLAAVLKLRENNHITSRDKAVLVLTGSGIKTLDKTYWLLKQTLKAPQ